MKRRILTFVLAALLCVGLFPAAGAAADLPFTDVPPGVWYYDYVKSAVDTGLVNGKTATTYCPDDYLTYAEAVKLAACMHQKHLTASVTLTNGDPWYQSYVDYAKTNGIISKEYDWKEKATRAGYMEIFAHALPDDWLIHGQIPMKTIPALILSPNAIRRNTRKITEKESLSVTAGLIKVTSIRDTLSVTD